MTETKGLPFSYTATQFSSRSKVVFRELEKCG